MNEHWFHSFSSTAENVLCVQACSVPHERLFTAVDQWLHCKQKLLLAWPKYCQLSCLPVRLGTSRCWM